MENWNTLGSSVSYVAKIFRKTNIFYPLVRTCACVYQGIRNVSFSENIAYGLNRWSISENAVWCCAIVRMKQGKQLR